MARYTQCQKNVIDKLKGGATLSIAFEDGGKLFTLDDHEPVNARTVESLLKHGVVREAGDAMFGVSQSIELAV